MTLLLLALSFVFPVGAGWMIVSILFQSNRVRSIDFKIWMALGTGFGLASVNLSLFVVLFGSVKRSFIWGELFLLSVILFCFFVRQRGNSSQNEQQLQEVPAEKASWVVSVLFFGLLAIQLVISVILTLQTPHGYGDAVAFWNSQARFLFRAGTEWKEALRLIGGLRSEYPFLVPATIVRFWSYGGAETILAPPLTAFIFTFGTVGLLVSSLSIARGRTQGFVGGLFLLATPFFISHGASQYADVPFGFFVLTSIALLSLSDQFEEVKWGLLSLSGAMAGFAAWTKNEGLLFLVSLIFSWILVHAFTIKRSGFDRKLVAFMSGALPVLTLVIAFKVILATKNDLLATQGTYSPGKLLELTRYIATLKAFSKELLRFDSIPFLALLVYGLFLQTEPTNTHRRSVYVSLLALSLTLAGYFLIYVTTPYDLVWHLETSLSRLLLQLWPSTIFISLIFIRRPETTLQKTQTVTLIEAV